MYVFVPVSEFSVPSLKGGWIRQEKCWEDALNNCYYHWHESAYYTPGTAHILRHQKLTTHSHSCRNLSVSRKVPRLLIGGLFTKPASVFFLTPEWTRTPFPSLPLCEARCHRQWNLHRSRGTISSLAHKASCSWSLSSFTPPAEDDESCLGWHLWRQQSSKTWRAWIFEPPLGRKLPANWKHQWQTLHEGKKIDTFEPLYMGSVVKAAICYPN